MTWNEQWSIKIDGQELNTAPTGGNYVASIPEIENVADYDAVTVPIDGDYPAFIRLQPRESTWTLNIAMKACNWATYQTQIASLKTLLAPGIHTLAVQIRGMTAAKSATVVVRGMMIQPTARALSVTLFVPKPVLA